MTSYRQRGMSIIELMVGLVIALLIGLAATGSAISFTAAQRQGVGASGASTNVANILQAIKSDIASGGLGFRGEARFLCSQMNFSVDTAALLDGATSFSPVNVLRTAGNDQLDVLYANQVDSGANVALYGPTSSTSTTADLKSWLPAVPGQAVLLARDPDPLNTSPLTPCLVRTVTEVQDSTDTAKQRLTFGAGGVHNRVPFTTPSNFGDNDRIALLGSLHWSRYTLASGNLSLTLPLESRTAVLVRNVVSFRVQYGLSNAAGTAPVTWENPVGAYAALSAAGVEQLRAVRIGIVTRSPQREKRDKDGRCSMTPSMPMLFDVAVEPDVSDFQCFRHNVSTVVVPLRNLAWNGG